MSSAHYCEPEIMLDTINRTPYSVALIPFGDKAGLDYAGLVIKGTWTFGTDGNLALADEQEPIHRVDIRNGDADDASVRYPADGGWPKLATET